MNIVGNITTAAVALLGVLLGGLIAIRNQERAWRREHDRQWRDFRLNAYTEFVSAYRALLAYIVDPSAQITAKPHPRREGEMMPFYNEIGRPFREKLEVAESKIRLVAMSQRTTDSVQQVVIDTRSLAAARATSAHDDISDEFFVRLWVSQHAFMTAARAELGLDAIDDWTVPSQPLNLEA